MPANKEARKWKRLWPLPLLLVAIVAAAAIVRSRQPDPPSAAAVSGAPTDKPIGVGCRGRIEPEDGVIVIAAPYFSGRPSLVKELRVKEGDWVRSGQVISVLDGYESSQRAVSQSEADVEVSRMRMAQTKAGAKPADIEELKAEIARWESEYATASSDFERDEELRKNQIISNYAYGQSRLALERVRRTLDGAKERLKSLAEVRKEDVDVRSAELSSALAQVERAKADLERTVVRAPADGRVLKIHARPGEEVGSQGILELGRTAKMYVVAEVYESDISRVHVGQSATVSGELLQDKMIGRVTQIGTQVTKSELLPIEPAAFADARVVKVKVQLDSGESVAGLIYGKVDVVIQP